MKNKKENTKYIVGHYISFGPHREKEFHVDYTHDDMEYALDDWTHLCDVLPEAEVEIRKQTTEVVVDRSIDEQYCQNAFEKFTSTINQELTTIKESSVSGDVYPNITKEQWLTAIEGIKVQFQRQYEEFKECHEDSSKEASTFVKAFGLPSKSFFIAPVLRDIFVDDEVLSLTKGFMTGPVGLFNSRKVEAFDVQKYDNFPEMLSFLNLQSQTKDIVIYYTCKEGDKYVFRGAFVDKQ